MNNIYTKLIYMTESGAAVNKKCNFCNLLFLAYGEQTIKLIFANQVY